MTWITQNYKFRPSSHCLAPNAKIFLSQIYAKKKKQKVVCDLDLFAILNFNVAFICGFQYCVNEVNDLDFSSALKNLLCQFFFA